MSFLADGNGNIQDFDSNSCEISSNKSNCIYFRFNSSLQFHHDSALMSFNITLAPALSTTNVSFNLSEYLYPDPPFRKFNLDSTLKLKYDPSSVNFSKIGISDHQLYVKFDAMVVNNNSYTDISYPSFLFEPGDCSVINLSPTIKGSYYDNMGRFMGYQNEKSQFHLNPTITTLPKLTDGRQIQFAVIQRQYLRHEMQSSHSMANIGGFYVALSSIYVLLFGMSKLSPCLKRKLAKRYVAFSGIPLSQKVSNRRNDATLEDRVQMLETMLQDYYLDNYQWELLKKSVLKYDRLQRQYDQMTNFQNQKIIDSDSEVN
ncbi:18658_t:CDS:2 [Dentiscutata erythropus]|uniref:18658_t:CDS:1 n=1 Tax=Dentiscutata erythropus TaxID=1348616 RepID=A0A9N9I631_9GLOM|nr:18658_t:CDS:2 [Dentiscutata erythropus]